MENQSVHDVAIIGGGVSGVYCGVRLLTSKKATASPLPNNPLHVALFEQSSRIGGRLLSLQPPRLPSTRMEIGGMRYTTEHTLVRDLVAYFNLTPVPFPVQKPENLAYLRGEHLRVADLQDAKKLPYQLQVDECKKKDLGLGFTAIAAQRLLKEMTGEEVDLATVNWPEVVAKYKFEGMSLDEVPLRYLMQRMISHEAYAFAVDSSGYDSILYTWSGADGFPWNLADFGADVKYHRLAQGYQQLPLQLHDQFLQAGGVSHLEHSLVRFDEIVLDDGTAGVEFTMSHHGCETRHLARNLILAMPRRSLEMIEPSGKVMNSDNRPVRKLMESVTPIPLFKLALCYSHAWWEDLPTDNGRFKKIKSGESITDLPIRQVYYWAVDEETGHAVVLIYDDGLAQTYWAGLRDHEEKFLNQTAAANPVDGLPNWEDYPAPRRLVDEAHRQMLEIHNPPADLKVTAPYSAAYTDWGMDPYGGGANFWHVGVKSHRVSAEIVQPMAETPVFICGECYSHGQGWVEGALATAEDLLKNHLGLGPAIWQGAAAETTESVPADMMPESTEPEELA